jgi:hypothetical protein
VYTGAHAWEVRSCSNLLASAQCLSPDLSYEDFASPLSTEISLRRTALPQAVWLTKSRDSILSAGNLNSIDFIFKGGLSKPILRAHEAAAAVPLRLQTHYFSCEPHVNFVSHRVFIPLYVAICTCPFVFSALIKI